VTEESITPERVLEFTQRERAAVALDEHATEALSIEELVERGDAIQGLTITDSSRDHVTLRCSANDSRLRIGDRVILQSAQGRFTGTIADLRDDGCEVHLQSVQGTGEARAGAWTARALPVDVSALVMACVRKLQPGAPGWSFFRTCSDTSLTSVPASPEVSSGRRSAVATAVLAGQGLDASQEASFLSCLELPHAFAVQGPPGTGKTRVLALVAEALARMGKRTLVVAPTHQAVNNALSTIRRSFPARRTVKVGDELRRESLEPGVECHLFEDGTRQSGTTASSDSITGMTFVAALQHLILRRSGLAPNVILIEEAGQLPLAYGLCAGLIGAGSTLMFGDDLQMPPVFPAAVADEPLATSLLGHFRTLRPQAVSMLQITYRLNHELGNVISRVFYASALQSSTDASSRRFAIDLAGHAPQTPIARALSADASLVWVRSSPADAQQANVAEARFVATIVHTCLAAGLAHDSVAVVTPFRRQAALIRRAVQSRLPARSRLPIIDTVERVQGLTVELVVVSLCASAPAYVQSIASFLCSPNRLNVAVSRARTKAILVASSTLAEVEPAEWDSRSDFGPWRRLLEMASARIVI
jgi:DNA replication ATP-dependent helicase Dna2